jgi:hypothetical protein
MRLYVHLLLITLLGTGLQPLSAQAGVAYAPDTAALARMMGCYTFTWATSPDSTWVRPPIRVTLDSGPANPLGWHWERPFDYRVQSDSSHPQALRLGAWVPVAPDSIWFQAWVPRPQSDDIDLRLVAARRENALVGELQERHWDPRPGPLRPIDGIPLPEARVNIVRRWSFTARRVPCALSP